MMSVHVPNMPEITLYVSRDKHTAKTDSTNFLRDRLHLGYKTSVWLLFLVNLVYDIL